MCLLSVLNESESAESENNFYNARIKKIRKEFNTLRNFLSQKKKRLEEIFMKQKTKIIFLHKK